METLDEGHRYILKAVDNGTPQQLAFVMREGVGYPGNTNHYGGTQTQEVIRALIARQKYVNNQIPDERNTEVIKYLRLALFALEERAAERHGLSIILLHLVGERIDMIAGKEIENLPACRSCGHLVCHCL